MNFLNNIFNLYCFDDITFLDQVYSGKRKKLYKIGHYNYFPLTHKTEVFQELDRKAIINFLNILNPNFAYAVSPILHVSSDIKSNLPLMVLSKQILVDRSSNPKVITSFLHDQILSLEDHYNLSSLDGYIVFKYRPLIYLNTIENF